MQFIQSELNKVTQSISYELAQATFTCVIFFVLPIRLYDTLKAVL